MGDDHRKIQLTRLKINPQWLFVLAVVALPLLLVSLRSSLEPAGAGSSSLIQTDFPWGTVGLPAREWQKQREAGIEFITCARSDSGALLARVDTRRHPEAVQALKSGVREAGDLFVRLFHRAAFENLTVRRLPDNLGYRLDGRRRDDQWIVSGRLRHYPEQHTLLALLTVGREAEPTRHLAEQIAESFRLK